MLTVPACLACNNRKSRHDDFLRDILVTDVAAEGHPVTQQLFQNKTIRSHEQGKSLVARIALSSAQPVAYLNSDGEPDIAYVSRFDSARADEMFGYIVRGLYYARFKKSLSATTNVTVRRLSKSDVDQVVTLFNEVGANGPFELGDGVFSCVYNYGANTPEASIWLLEFYGCIQYSAITAPK